MRREDRASLLSQISIARDSGSGMTDSIIDRIAQAIQDSVRSDNVIAFGAYQDAARRAVAIMRAPTAGMKKAASDIPVGCCMTNASDAAEIWEYMIDAALAEPPAR